MKSHFLLIAPVLLQLGACAPRPDAAPRLAFPRNASAEYVFYEVNGDSPGPLWSAMRQSGPPSAGVRAFGRTTWAVTWRAQWGGGILCRVRSSDVRLDAEVTLPRWSPSASAPPMLVSWWDTFVRALSEHESGHVEIGASAKREVQRELGRLTSPGCATMQARANAAVARILDEHRARDREYDRRTRHGATQGATWPPPGAVNGAAVNHP